ncbi:MAG: serine protease, partial [Pseudomonadota bacterium]
MRQLVFLALIVGFNAHGSMDVKTAISKLTEKNDNSILEIANKATLRIDAYDPYSGSYAGGTAFFINPDGYIVTNYHVVKFLLSNDLKFIFTTYDGSTINGDFEITRCSDDRKIDLCIIKLNVKPEYYFNITTVQETKGDKIFVLGKTPWVPVVFDTGSVCC